MSISPLPVRMTCQRWGMTLRVSALSPPLTVLFCSSVVVPLFPSMREPDPAVVNPDAGETRGREVGTGGEAVGVRLGIGGQERVDGRQATLPELEIGCGRVGGGGEGVKPSLSVLWKTRSPAARRVSTPGAPSDRSGWSRDPSRPVVVVDGGAERQVAGAVDDFGARGQHEGRGEAGVGREQAVGDGGFVWRCPFRSAPRNAMPSFLMAGPGRRRDGAAAAGQIVQAVSLQHTRRIDEGRADGIEHQVGAAGILGSAEMHFARELSERGTGVGAGGHREVEGRAGLQVESAGAEHALALGAGFESDPASLARGVERLRGRVKRDPAARVRSPWAAR